MEDPKKLPAPVCKSFLSEDGWKDVSISGAVREIEDGGRKGLQILGVKSSLSVSPKEHTLNRDIGSLTFWLYPIEDFGYANEHGLFMDHEPDCLIYPILTDHMPLRQLGKAAFYIAGYTQWWRQMLFRFNRDQSASNPNSIVGDAGGFHECHGSHASFGPCDLKLRKENWYQLGLTWNHTTQEYYLYINGIRVANGHRWQRQSKDEVGEKLHAGTPAFAVGELCFYDTALDATNLAALCGKNPRGNEEPDKSLKKTHAPASLNDLEWPTDSGYKTELELSLTDPEDLKSFYLQGLPEAAKITEEGLLIETPVMAHPHDRPSQIYAHTWQTFEGDLDVEFEFMSLKEEGLALLMLHSSGMQREDYMKDHPLRTDPSMSMVHCENVRNYHWEFWREMDGIRSDVSTHAFIKNPRLRPLAYQAMPDLLPLHTWHTVRFIQDGRRLLGAVNNKVVFDVMDDPYDGSGPVYSFGHVSIRNMFKSKCLWKNLRVKVRPPKFSARAL